MKLTSIHLIIVGCMACAGCVQAQSQARAVMQTVDTGALTSNVATGGKTVTISPSGTLQWSSGATLGGAAVFRAAAGLAIGTDVQAHDADLASIAALTTTSYGRGLLTLADAAALGAEIGLEVGVDVQPYDADLASIAALTTTSYGRGLLTLADAAALGAEIGLEVGVDVQPYDADLASIAALTTTSYGRGLLTLTNAAALRAEVAPAFDVQSLLGAADVPAMRAVLGLGTLATMTPTGTPNGTKFLRDDGSWQAVAGGGIAIGSTAITGGTSGRLLTSGSTVGELTLGSGVATWMTTASSANLRGALTDETGTGAAVFGTDPTVIGKVTIEAAGESDGGGIEAIVDPLNASMRALRILPAGNHARIFFGGSGAAVFSLNLQHVGQIENMPLFTVGDFTVGALANTSIRRGDGGTEIGANHPTGYGLDVYQTNTWGSPTIADRALNVHRADGVTYFGSSTSRTNYEGVNLGVSGEVYHLWTVAGAAGGTARDLVIGTDEAERMRVTDAGVSIGGGAPIAAVLSATATLDFGEFTDPDTAQQSAVTVTGAADGDGVILGLPDGAIADPGVRWQAWVSGADMVTIQCAIGAGGVGTDLPECIYQVTVIKH